MILDNERPEETGSTDESMGYWNKRFQGQVLPSWDDRDLSRESVMQISFRPTFPAPGKGLNWSRWIQMWWPTRSLAVCMNKLECETKFPWRQTIPTTSSRPVGRTTEVWIGPRLWGFHVFTRVNYNDLTTTETHRWWLFTGESSPNGRTIQVSELK